MKNPNGGRPPVPKPRRSRKWLWGGPLLLVAAVVVVWALWPPPPPPPKPAATAESQARMETLALTEIQEGDKRWTLEAKNADFLKDQNQIRITGVKVEFFGGPDKVVRVKAQEGLINTKDRVLTLKGDVEMVSGDLRITTSMVTYQPAGRLLLAPEEVTLEEPRLKIQGKGLKVELAEKKLVLAQHRLTQLKVQGMELKP
ncbi:MAG: LPS export ABC transporter periplasmic protein LptC [Thermodesulfobacteriota bacterium]